MDWKSVVNLEEVQTANITHDVVEHTAFTQRSQKQFTALLVHSRCDLSRAEKLVWNIVK